MKTVSMQKAKGRSVQILLTIAACAALLLPGCRNPAEPGQPHDAPGQAEAAPPAGTGTLSLAIGARGAGRTILPGTTRHDFVSFRLDFSPAPECGLGNTGTSEYQHRDSLTDGAAELELNAGTWNLGVTAFLERAEGERLEAASGSLAGIKVPPGGTVEGGVTLYPIRAGRGGFAWAITFEQNITAAYMLITRIDETPYRGPVHLVADGAPVPGGSPGSLELYSGQYRVVFALRNDRGEGVRISETLHVYQNMQSGFAGTFGRGHFPATLLNHILDSWNGDQWDFYEAGITAWHFGFLGMGGICDDNFDKAVSWFNALCAESPAPTDVAGLRALADAALVGMGTGAGFRAAAVYQGAVQTAVEKMAVNNSDIVFRWEDGSSVLTVGTGAGIACVETAAYTVRIDFGRHIPPLPPLTGEVRITGTALVGATLTADTDGLGGEGAVSFLWKRRNAAGHYAEIDGETGNTYTVRLADVGYAIVVTVTRAGNSGSVAGELANTIQPLVTWTATVVARTSVTTTGIDFEFDSPVELTESDITVADGTGAVNRAGLTGHGTSWRLGIDVARAGNVAVSINRADIESGPWTVAVSVPRRLSAAHHTVTVTADGQLWAWGWNSSGQLGDGTTTDRHSPVRIGEASNWASVAAGWRHTAAVTTDGQLWAWRDRVELVDGTFIIHHSIPVRIGEASNWASVAAGYYHTVAVTTDGQLWAWGGNSSSPVRIGTASNWASVAAVDRHTVAVTTDGQLWAWGFNGYGQLGDGTTTNRTSPVRIGEEHNWASVAAGGLHTVAVTTDGRLWAWGNNHNGQLGNGTRIDSHSPVLICEARNWVSVAAVGLHTVAVTTDGQLWAWGWNSSGQLGDGTTTDRLSPVRIGEANNWTSVAAGAMHTIAVTTDDQLWAWGHNSNGQLGDGTTITRPSPVRVFSRFVRIEGGTFLMGSPASTPNSDANERPVRQVTVSGFYMSRFQVTQGEWYEVMHHLPGGVGAGTRRPGFFNGTNVSGGGTATPTFDWRNLPVERVSWFEAVEFANRLSVSRGLTPAYTISGTTVTWNRQANGYRLPTEAEWEFAARGGIVCHGNFTFSGSNIAAEVAWHSTNSGSRTREVGTLKPNALGLYDMSGNVWEWVWDCHGTYPNIARTNPVGAYSVARGGSWAGPAAAARSVVREGLIPSYQSLALGFRLVRPISN